jgi:hypothetical protein
MADAADRGRERSARIVFSRNLLTRDQADMRRVALRLEIREDAKANLAS